MGEYAFKQWLTFYLGAQHFKMNQFNFNIHGQCYKMNEIGVDHLILCAI